MTQIKLYRGESGDLADLSTVRASLTFTDNREEAIQYARSPLNQPSTAVVGARPRLIQAEVTYNNPWLKQPKSSWLELGWVIEKVGYDEAFRIALKFSEDICHTNNWDDIVRASNCVSVKAYLERYPDNLKKLYFRAYPFFDDEEEINRLRSQGYDCAIMGLMPDFKGGLEYRVFNASAVRILSILPV